MRYVALFILIQLVNLPLMVLGWFICLDASLAHALWLWWNTDDDALIESMSWFDRYVYLAWRNPVANLRRVPGVSGKGRPIWYWSNGKFYAKAGWMTDGYPCLSCGSGKGY
jgi:hypothetical protein